MSVCGQWDWRSITGEMPSVQGRGATAGALSSQVLGLFTFLEGRFFLRCFLISPPTSTRSLTFPENLHESLIPEAPGFTVKHVKAASLAGVTRAAAEQSPSFRFSGSELQRGASGDWACTGSKRALGVPHWVRERHREVRGYCPELRGLQTGQPCTRAWKHTQSSVSGQGASIVVPARKARLGCRFPGASMLTPQSPAYPLSPSLSVSPLPFSISEGSGWSPSHSPLQG